MTDTQPDRLDLDDDDMVTLGDDGTPPDPCTLAAAVFDSMMARDPVPGSGFGSVSDSDDVPFICAAWAIGPAATAELIAFMRGLAQRHPTDSGFIDSCDPDARAAGAVPGAPGLKLADLGPSQEELDANVQTIEGKCGFSLDELGPSLEQTRGAMMKQGIQLVGNIEPKPGFADPD